MIDKRFFAKHLRINQLKLGVAEPEIINALSDDEIIDSYRFCNGCGKEIFNMEDLEAYLLNMEDPEKILDMLYRNYNCEHRESDFDDEYDENDPVEVVLIQYCFSVDKSIVILGKQAGCVEFDGSKAIVNMGTITFNCSMDNWFYTMSDKIVKKLLKKGKIIKKDGVDYEFDDYTYEMWEDKHYVYCLYNDNNKITAQGELHKNLLKEINELNIDKDDSDSDSCTIVEIAHVWIGDVVYKLAESKTQWVVKNNEIAIRVDNLRGDGISVEAQVGYMENETAYVDDSKVDTILACCAMPEYIIKSVEKIEHLDNSDIGKFILFGSYAIFSVAMFATQENKKESINYYCYTIEQGDEIIEFLIKQLEKIKIIEDGE